MANLDWSFISLLEGGQVLDGYVPAATNSQSGVTIATGFDIGQRSVKDLQALGFPPNLVTQLATYTGLRGPKAVAKLKAFPLHITAIHATLIDKAVKSAEVTNLETAYDKDTKTGVKFSQLPREAQTVIASVTFQHGKLRGAAPKFWSYVIRQDWGHAIKELRNFGDKFRTRRNKEADLLEKIPTNATGRLSDEARTFK